MVVFSALQVVHVDFGPHSGVPENWQDIALDRWEYNFVVDMGSFVCDHELLWTHQCTVEVLPGTFLQWRTEGGG